MVARLGELLLDANQLTPRQLEQAVEYQTTHTASLAAAVVALGFCRDADLAAVLSRHYGVPSIALDRFDIEPAIVALVPRDRAVKHQMVPVSRGGSLLTLAMVDPADVMAIDDVRFATGCNVETVIAAETAMAAALEKYYPARGTSRVQTESGALEAAARALHDLPVIDSAEAEPPDDVEEISAAALARLGHDAPIVKLVDILLMSAVQRGASDVHIEPYERELRVRCRIDGMLHEIAAFPVKFRDAITSRVKIMARLDIAEKRLPQDGRIRIRYADDGAGKHIDLRVSSLPTLFGEKLVLRLLDRGTLMLDMARLGFEPESLARFEAAIEQPWGMVLVTGPTGSGKTNTLYSAMARLNRLVTNVMTAEDPIEFNLRGINQVQVRDAVGLTFASALRAFLRQDPNIILVGEIRDLETAQIAVRAALTGHLVLSTLHTNDAPSTINRLLNMGIEPFLVASALTLVCAQRLVRRLCPSCREPHVLPPSALVHAGFTPEEAESVVPMRAGGCGECGQTGYRGRVGLYEVMEVTESIRDLVLAGAPVVELRRAAAVNGMVTLRRSGLRKVRDGVTALEEVARETGTTS
jgi:type IV pilus assembly protein PilB